MLCFNQLIFFILVSNSFLKMCKDKCEKKNIALIPFKQSDDLYYPDRKHYSEFVPVIRKMVN